MSLILRFLFLPLFGLFILSCSRGIVETEELQELQVNKSIVAFEISPTISTINPGETQVFKAYIYYGNGTSEEVSDQSFWWSSTPTTASLVNPLAQDGRVRGNSSGVTSINVTYKNITKSAVLNVKQADIIDIEVSPLLSSIASGNNQQFTATAIYSDATHADITSAVNWESLDSSIMIVANNLAPGLFVGSTPGSTQVKASYLGLEGIADIQVTSAVLTGITVTPINQPLPQGNSLQFYATGIYSDGTTQDITSSSIWSSSDSAIASVSDVLETKGSVKANALGSVILKAQKAGLEGISTVTVTDAELVGLEINPSSLSLPAGISSQLQVSGSYSNGLILDLTSQVAWSSQDDTIAFMNNAIGEKGKVISQSEGDTIITASLNGVSSQINITVTSAELESIDIHPDELKIPNGTHLNAIATGNYSDGSNRDITNLVTWSTVDNTIASVSNAPHSNGNISSYKVGKTNLLATYGSANSEKEIEVTEATLISVSVMSSKINISQGLQQNLNAIGLYSDGTTVDITKDVLWTSTNEAIAQVNNTIDNKGLLYTLAQGPVEIEASLEGKAGRISLNVTAPEIILISLSPEETTLSKGQSLSLTVNALYSNGNIAILSEEVNWTSSDPTVIGVITSGQLEAINEGLAIIELSIDGNTYDFQFEVKPAILTDLQIETSQTALSLGQSLNITVTGIYSDSSTKDLTSEITLISSDPSIMEVSLETQGLLISKDEGTATITANFGGIEKSIEVTVGPPSITSISLLPLSLTLSAGNEHQLEVYALLTNGTSTKLAAEVNFSSSNQAVASINSQGVIKANTTGVATIRAEYEDHQFEILVSVTEAVLTDINFTLPPLTIPAGLSLQVSATGVFSDSSTHNITGMLSWQSDNTHVAQIESINSNLVTIKTNHLGAVNISASHGEVTKSFTINVSEAALSEIKIYPSTPSLSLGQNLNLQVSAIKTDGSEIDITSATTWLSSDPAVLTVNSLGVITAMAVGSATVTGTHNGLTNTISVATTPAILTGISIQNSPSSIALGYQRQLAAIGQYSDGSSRDISNEVSWSSSQNTIASVSASGLLTTNATGVSQISVSLNGQSSTTSINVTPPILTALNVLPNNTTISIGLGRQFTAIGVYSNGSTQNITNSVQWSISGGLILGTISSTGNFIGISLGTTKVKAKLGSIEAEATITVLAF